MSHAINWIDRLRIERVVWSLDQRLYDLPRRSRIEKRREVRANLVTAAHDVGARTALKQLGTAPQLAREYLSAEFGDAPRHSWMAAGVFAASMPLLLNWILFEAIFAFRDGVLARDPHATGKFAWKGVPYIQSAVTYTLANGKGESLGGAWTPLVYLLLVLGTVLVGRLWRIPVARRPRRRQSADVAAA